MKLPSINNLLFSIGLAAILTFAIFIFIPPVNQRLNIKLVETKLRAENRFYYYEDLNGDGISEEYRTYKNSAGSAAFDGYLEENKYMDQWNFKGTYTYSDFIHFHDIDKNGFKDVILTTCEDDSIRLNIFNPISKEILLDNFPIIAIEDKNDLFLNIEGCVDIDGNGEDEIILIVNAGYNLQPRKIILFEYATGILKSSPLIGGFLGLSEIKDVDNDGKKEILIQSYSTDNYKEPVPYSDISSWSILLDHDLKIMYNPIENPVPLSVTQNAFLKEKDGNLFIILLCYDQNKNKAVIKKSDLQGNILNEIELPEIPGEKYYFLNNHKKGEVFLFNAKTGFLKIDSDLNFTSKIKILNNSVPPLKRIIDIDNDGIDEYISDLSATNGIYFSDLLEKEPIFLQLPVNKIRNKLIYSSPKTQDKKYNFYIQADTQGFYINYGKNKFFWTRYLIYLGAFLGLFVLIELVRWQQRKTFEKKAEREKKLVEWQLQSVKNQLDPHFTFNALNAIGSAIYKEKKEVAYDIFTQFSHLFRKSLEDGHKLTRTLKDEIEFVKNYISIQKFRFSAVFDFKILVEDNVDSSMKIPKLVIQNFVENAIYHGLIPRKKEGLITITITQNKQSIVVIIEDNGVGREATRNNNNSTGKGLKLLQNYFDLLNKNNHGHLTYEIMDLYDKEKPIGTKVKLTIPLKFKYS